MKSSRWGLDVDIPVSKNAENEGAIPSAWRPAIVRIVDALACKDYGLSSGIAGVMAVSEETAAQIRDYIDDYGATLAALPPETWNTSVCIWAGHCWDALVDLWTLEEGRSDLVLKLRIFEDAGGELIEVDMAYVP